MIAALLALALAVGGGIPLAATSGGNPPGARAAASAAAADPGYLFARSLARAGPRPAGSAAERRAHARVEKRFVAAGLRIGHDRFRVPGHGRSRNVVGIYDTPADCLVVLTAHTDSVPPGARGGRQRLRGRDARRARAPARHASAPPATCG